MKLILILLLIPVLTGAQEFEFQLETDSIPVMMEGWAPFEPWAGGESQSYPALFDIDNDGDYDFFIGNFWGTISYFDNNGSIYYPDYQFMTYEFVSINLSGFFFGGSTSPQFSDLDADGDGDLFSGDFAGLIHYWENIGTAQSAQFELVTDTLAGIDADGYSKFNFIDLDADGDFDIILGDYFGKVWLYSNIGTAQAFNFLNNPLWINGIDVGQYASPELIDIDSDLDYDLFIGNSSGKIWYYRNNGDSVNYNFTYVTNNYINIDVGDYASPEFADIDGDGDFDLFVGRDANTASPIGDIFYYENIGTPQVAQFQLVAKNYLMLDVEKFSCRPQLVDINADSAIDLLVGAWSQLDYFQNIGSSQSAEYLFIENNFQGINEPGIKPFFVDIDNDGDQDLFCGEAVIPGLPAIALYLNQGTPYHPNLQLYNSQFITNSDFFVNINPVLADIDADVDFDLFANDDEGNFYYYQNNGSSAWPTFNLVTSTWQGIQFTYPNDGWRGFTFGDLDQDGDLDLLMKEHHAFQYDGNLLFYRNDGNAQSPAMNLVTHSFLQDSVNGACPYLVDIDLDNDLDLFCGVANGGIMFFRNVTGQSPVDPRKRPAPTYPTIDLTLQPNPGNPVAIVLSLPAPQPATLAVYNLLGAKVVTLTTGLQPAGQQRYFWETTPAASGVYLVRLEAGGETITKKLTVVK